VDNAAEILDPIGEARCDDAMTRRPLPPRRSSYQATNVRRCTVVRLRYSDASAKDGRRKMGDGTGHTSSAHRPPSTLIKCAWIRFSVWRGHGSADGRNYAHAIHGWRSMHYAHHV